jgi:carbonic anhydrase
MELEFVHAGGADGPGTIVSVFVTPGQKNAALEAVLRALPKGPGATSSPSGVSFDPAALLPAKLTYIDYSGSFTSPPCTERVRWCVLRTPIQASQDQLDRYTRDPRLAHTARPLMPSNGRLVRMAASP